MTAREFARPDYPAALFRCAAWPVPSTAPADVFALVEWLARAKAAHADCAWRLACAGRAVSAEGARDEPVCVATTRDGSPQP